MHNLFSLFSGGGGEGIAAYVMDLSSGLPAGATHTSNDTVKTYRDSSGQMRIAAANTALFDHDADGNALGLQCFESRTNRCTNYNAVPTATTNLSVTGDATVSITTDSSALSTAKLANVVTGNVFEASGGAGGGTVVIAGSIDATGSCSASLYARITAGANASFGITPDASATSISGSNYQCFVAENLNATATSDTLVITIPASTTVRFILNQLETGKFASPIIITAGATATRQKQFTKIDAINEASWFGASNGTIIVEATPALANGQPNPAGVVVAGSAGGFPTDAFYIQTNSNSNATNAYAKGNNVSNNVAALSSPLTGRKNSLGIIYRNGTDVRSFSGPMVTSNIATSMTNSASGINTLTIGSFAANTWHFNGWINKIQFFKQALSLPQAAPFAIGAATGHTERGIICGGQSNIEGYFSSAVTATNGGEHAAIGLLDDVWGTSTRNWLINAATGGTSFVSWQGTEAAITKWKLIATAFVRGGGSIDSIIWDHGESNTGNSVASFKSAYEGIFDDMIAHLSSLGQTGIKICIQPLGRYRLNSSSAHNTNCSYLRQAQQELAAENSSTICLGPEKSHQPLVDNLVHLTDAGYASQAVLTLRKALDFNGETISGAVDGPTIGTPTLSGTTVTVPITHTDGTDFTPTSAIGGFQFYDDGTDIAISSAVRTNATTITLTLASTPSGTTKELWYAWGSLYNDLGSTLVRDNSAYAMPLRAGKWTVA